MPNTEQATALEQGPIPPSMPAPVAGLVVEGVCPLRFRYRNWRGERADRFVVPIRVWFGRTPHHPEPQWFLAALDMDKGGARRDFAMCDMELVRHD